jgi:DNA-3-methyladenine glycosylase II
MSVVYVKAQRHLARRDRVLKNLIAAVGPCTLATHPHRFEVLVRSIISQQLSTKAALTIGTRLQEAVGKRGLTPRSILELSDERMRAAGLSAAKVRSLRDLAEKVHGKVVPLDDLEHCNDEQVIECLLPVLGIGRWTAEMFLIFCLGRLDVLPVADLGLRHGVRDQYGLPEAPDGERLVEMAEPWRPYRSIATWYFWRSRGFVPQSK